MTGGHVWQGGVGGMHGGGGDVWQGACLAGVYMAGRHA